MMVTEPLAIGSLSLLSRLGATSDDESQSGDW